MTIQDLVIKASLLIVAFALTHVAFGRRVSAAARHLSWTLAIVSLLALPVLSAVLPQWSVVPDLKVRPTYDASPGAVASPDLKVGGSNVTPDRPPGAPDLQVGGPRLLPLLYLAGVAFLLGRLFFHHVLIRRIARRSMEVSEGEWSRLLLEGRARLGITRPVRLLRSRDETMPMAFGLLKGTVVVPAVADDWPADRRRAVLMHELAHIARHDCATHALAAVVCALYWMHPGVWWVSRRLRIERELACDDRVLAAGARARDYADHLLEVAYTFGGRFAPALAVRMAASRQLEGRLIAVLDASRRRAHPSARTCATVATVVAAMLVPLSAATTVPRPIAQAQPPVSARTQASVQTREDLPGTWEIRPTTVAGTVNLRTNEADSQHGSNFELRQLEGLTAAQMAGAGTAVKFTLRRDAGTFTFEGIFRTGVGGGTFTFAPSDTFAAELVKRGFQRPSSRDLRRFARADMGLAFLDELTAQKYERPSLAELISAADHGVSLEYLHEMGQLGYHLGKVEALSRQRDHGVSTEYIRQMSGHGLTNLSADELIQARDHGVSPEYVAALAAHGYKGLTLKPLIDARDHGVSADYIAGVHGLGHTWTLPEHMRARDHGVSPEFIQAFKALGYDRLTFEELIQLRDHGVSPERAKAANAKAGTRLSIEALKNLAANGWR